MKVTVGQRAQRTLTLTSDHVNTFAALTGDYNPLHFDEGDAWCYTLRPGVSEGST